MKRNHQFNEALRRRPVLPSSYPDAQNHQGGYSAKFYYQDIHYTCAGCGRPGVWTAQQQKKYFEVQKGNIHNEPKWCYQCHSSGMKNKEATPNKA
jgi:hypothetical protein